LNDLYFPALESDHGNGGPLREVARAAHAGQRRLHRHEADALFRRPRSFTYNLKKLEARDHRRREYRRGARILVVRQKINEHFAVWVPSGARDQSDHEKKTGKATACSRMCRFRRKKALKTGASAGG